MIFKNVCMCVSAYVKHATAPTLPYLYINRDASTQPHLSLFIPKGVRLMPKTGGLQRSETKQLNVKILRNLLARSPLINNSVNDPNARNKTNKDEIESKKYVNKRTCKD